MTNFGTGAIDGALRYMSLKFPAAYYGATLASLRDLTKSCTQLVNSYFPNSDATDAFCSDELLNFNSTASYIYVTDVFMNDDADKIHYIANKTGLDEQRVSSSI